MNYYYESFADGLCEAFVSRHTSGRMLKSGRALEEAFLGDKPTTVTRTVCDRYTDV